jgi:hypothetical protein
MLSAGAIAARYTAVNQGGAVQPRTRSCNRVRRPGSSIRLRLHVQSMRAPHFSGQPGGRCVVECSTRQRQRRTTPFLVGRPGWCRRLELAHEVWIEPVQARPVLGEEHAIHPARGEVTHKAPAHLREPRPYALGRRLDSDRMVGYQLGTTDQMVTGKE